MTNVVPVQYECSGRWCGLWLLDFSMIPSNRCQHLFKSYSQFNLPQLRGTSVSLLIGECQLLWKSIYWSALCLSCLEWFVHTKQKSSSLKELFCHEIEEIIYVMCGCVEVNVLCFSNCVNIHIYEMKYIERLRDASLLNIKVFMKHCVCVVYIGVTSLMLALCN